MGRLESHQQKQFRKQLIFYSAIFFGIILFMYFFGIKLLLSSSFFFTKLIGGGNDTPDTSNTDMFLGRLDIDTIPVATNSAQFFVSGSATDYDTVVFYINGKEVKKISLKSDSFNEQIGDLKKDDNIVYISAENKTKKKKTKSQDYIVRYKNDKPKLEVSEPQDNSTTDNYEIKVAGKTDRDNTVRANGSPLVVNADGSFNTLVRLKEGENKIEITVQDDAGNEEKKILTVTYSKD